jgi:hypothetical protein
LRFARAVADFKSALSERQSLYTMNNPGQSGLPSVKSAFLNGVMMPVVYDDYVP